MLLTTRITISSFLVAAMSVYACVLLAETPARAQQVGTVNKTQLKQDASLNRRPLTDFVHRVFKMQERGELDLSSDAGIFIEGELDSVGALQSVVITQKYGDPVLKQLAEELVRALNESHALSFLNEVKHLRLAIDSSQTDVAANASFALESETQAKQKTKAYDLLLHMAALTKRGRDEELIYRNLRASSNANEITIAFSMPRETFCALLSKYLSSN